MTSRDSAKWLRTCVRRFREMPLLVSNTLWLVSTQLLQLGLRMAYFILLTRALGSQQYGAFVGTTALVSLCYPLVSLGMGNLLIKNVAHDRARFNTYWGTSLLIISVSSLLLILLVLPLSHFILPASIPRELVLCVAIADLFLASTIDLAAKAFQSISWLSRTGMLLASVNLCRLIAAAVMLHFFPNITALGWGVLYMVSTALATILGVVMVTRDIGRPHLMFRRIRHEAGEGIQFTMSAASLNMRNQMGKVMLARMATLEMTGIFGAASRLIDLALIPVRALMQAAYPRFFKEGAHGMNGALNVARRLLPVTVLLGLIASAGIYLMAPVVPYILGVEYRSAVEALRWLSPVPLLRAIILPASDTLSGAGCQATRCSLLGAAALLNLIANVWLIPQYAWKGAACAAIGADTFLMGSLWLAVVLRCRSEERGVPQ
jgi:O-antigen/teichoic acid export membrane protein